MQRIAKWSIVLVAALAFFTAMLALAARAGRMIEPRLVVSPQGFPGDVLVYEVTDTARHITVDMSMLAPDVIDATWVSEPPLLLQRVRGATASAYTLTELDATAGVLRPVATIATQANVPLIALSFVLRRTPEGMQAAVYLADGEIWTTSPGDVAARKLATVDANLQFPLQWSPDGATLSVKDNRFPTMALVTAADGTVRRVDAPRDSWPVWSPDSRYILLNTAEIISENAPIRVVDVAAGGVAPLTAQLTGRIARWCGEGAFAYVHHPREGYSEVRLTDVPAGRTETLMSTDALLGQVVLSTAPVEGHGCDWLIVGTQHYSENGSRLYLVQRATGSTTLLGTDAQVMDVTGDTLTYDTMAGGVRTRRTIVLTP